LAKWSQEGGMVEKRGRGGGKKDRQKAASGDKRNRQRTTGHSPTGGGLLEREKRYKKVPIELDGHRFIQKTSISGNST